MKKFTPLLLATLVLFACKKNHDVTPPPPVQSDTTFSSNLIYLASAGTIQRETLKDIEFIVSEPDGKVLLDTIADVNKPVAVSVTTKKRALDLSVIRYITTLKTWSVTVHKAINLGEYSILPGSDSVPGVSASVTPPYVVGSVYYTNLPTGSNIPYQMTSFNGGSSWTYSATGPADNHLKVNYIKFANDYNYLVLPTLGLYNFRKAVNVDDTVDASSMDKCSIVDLTVPSSFNFQYISAAAYPDTTNPDKFLLIYNYASDNDTLFSAKLAYPGKKTFSKYRLSESMKNDAAAINVNYYNPWCDTISAPPFVLDDSYFSVTSAQNNNFSIQFNKIKPGYYTAFYSSTNIYLNLSASGDSTTLHPVDFVTALKSKRLAGQDLNALKAGSFTYSVGVDHGNAVPMKIPRPANGKTPYNIQPSTMTLTKTFK